MSKNMKIIIVFVAMLCVMYVGQDIPPIPKCRMLSFRIMVTVCYRLWQPAPQVNLKQTFFFSVKYQIV